MENKTLEERVTNIERMLSEIYEELKDLRPMLDKYKTVSAATSWRERVKAMKND